MPINKADGSLGHLHFGTFGENLERLPKYDISKITDSVRISFFLLLVLCVIVFNLCQHILGILNWLHFSTFYVIYSACWPPSIVTTRSWLLHTCWSLATWSSAQMVITVWAVIAFRLMLLFLWLKSLIRFMPNLSWSTLCPMPCTTSRRYLSLLHDFCFLLTCLVKLSPAYTCVRFPPAHICIL